MKTKFTYICFGILEVCENARITQTAPKLRIRISEYQKMVKLYFLGYPDSHKDQARRKKGFYSYLIIIKLGGKKVLFLFNYQLFLFNIFKILRFQRSTQNVIKMLKMLKTLKLPLKV